MALGWRPTVEEETQSSHGRFALVSRRHWYERQVKTSFIVNSPSPQLHSQRAPQTTQTPEDKEIPRGQRRGRENAIYGCLLRWLEDGGWYRVGPHEITLKKTMATTSTEPVRANIRKKHQAKDMKILNQNWSSHNGPQKIYPQVQCLPLLSSSEKWLKTWNKKATTIK